MNTFVLVGTIISADPVFATVAFQLNPPVNGGDSLAVMPVSAIPCDVVVGKKIYVVKDEHQDLPTVSCEKEKTQISIE